MNIKTVRNTIYSTKQFEAEYTYYGKDLGANWTKEETTFRVWAPTAKGCSVIGYEEGVSSNPKVIFEYPMKKGEKGAWSVSVPGNLERVYYTYKVEHSDCTIEACDPYAKAVGVNGHRAMVLNMEVCNPEGWEEDCNPNATLQPTDTIIYEMSIRDFSMDTSSGIQKKGTFLGAVEENTTNSYGQSTGLAHLKELGITHVHLLPIYDFGSIDEENSLDNQYNWGYDPVNYNVPEGSYATDACDGEVRIRELKQMIQTFHQHGISVVMDVVYNHVYDAGTYCMNQIVPGYFSRINENGDYSNGSFCGNDTASERSMVRKYIVESVLHWVNEYHMDGFRFDLVGLLDIEVINEIVREVHKIRPDVIFYGEGWDMKTEITKPNQKMAIQMNSQYTPDFAYFNDGIRDLLKGNYADETARGYVNGAKGNMEALKSNIMGIPYWSPSPSQTVQYVSCHDDFGFYDRMKCTVNDATAEVLESYQRMAAAMILLSQGIPFIHAGEEMLRSKQRMDGTLVSNSYNASDYVNSMKWERLNNENCQKMKEYYKGLIAFRKAHPALRLTTAQEVRECYQFLGEVEGEVCCYEIDTKHIEGESVEKIVVICNPEEREIVVPLQDGIWDVVIYGEVAAVESLERVEKEVSVPRISVMVLVKNYLQ